MYLGCQRFPQSKQMYLSKIHFRVPKTKASSRLQVRCLFLGLPIALFCVTQATNAFIADETTFVDFHLKGYWWHLTAQCFRFYYCWMLHFASHCCVRLLSFIHYLNRILCESGRLPRHGALFMSFSLFCSFDKCIRMFKTAFGWLVFTILIQLLQS